MKRNSSLLNVESILDNAPENPNPPTIPPGTAPLIYHRRMYSADTTLNRHSVSSNSFFDYSTPSNFFTVTSDFELLNHRFPSDEGQTSTVPDYYQQLLLQEEEDQKRRELQKFLYENVPKYSAPPVPEETSTTDEFEKFLDTETTTSGGRTLANELKLVYNNYKKEEKQRINLDQNAIISSNTAEPIITIEMTNEGIKTPDFIDQNLTLKEIEDFSLSVDENSLPQNCFTPSSVDSSSPRSLSEPPKRHKRLAGTRRKLPKDPDLEMTPATDDEKYAENEEYSMFLCSPSASHSNSAEFPGGMDSESSVSADEKKSEVILQTRRKSASLNIQSRPLPPIPLDAPVELEDIPAEPDETPPEPTYEIIDDEHSYETVCHQRSVSDHVLAIRKNSDDEKIRKSNSDISERRANRAGSTANETSNQVESPVTPERKVSSTGKISCSTPSIEQNSDDEKRKISMVNNSESEKLSKLTKSSEFGPIKLREPSHSVIEQKYRSPKAQDKQDKQKDSPKSTEGSSHHSIAALMDKFVSKRQVSEPHIQMTSKHPLSPKEGSTIRKSFKWKNFLPTLKSNSFDHGNKDEKKDSGVQRSASSAESPTNERNTVKMRSTNLRENVSSSRLCTLDENPAKNEDSIDYVNEETLNQICQAPKITRKSTERPWRGFLTRSFYGQKKSDNIKIEIKPEHHRRISVVGDVEYDRKIYAPSPEANEKLDYALRKGFGDIPTYQTDDSFVFSSDDEGLKADISMVSNGSMWNSPRRKSELRRMSSFRNLSKQKRNIIGTPVKMGNVENSKCSTLPRKPRGIKKRKQRREMVQRRRTMNLVLESLKLDDVTEAQLVKKIEVNQSPLKVEKLSRQAMSSVDVHPGNGTLKRKKKNPKRFVSSSAVGDVNNQILKPEKKSSGISFSTIWNKGKKKSKDSRNLTDIYASFSGSPGTSATFPIRSFTHTSHDSVFDSGDDIRQAETTDRPSVAAEGDSSFSNEGNLNFHLNSDYLTMTDINGDNSTIDTVGNSTTNVIRGNLNTPTVLSMSNPRRRTFAIREKTPNVVTSDSFSSLNSKKLVNDNNQQLTVKRNSIVHHRSTGDLSGDVVLKKKFEPSCLSSSFWNLIATPTAIINCAAEYQIGKRSESLVDISGIASRVNSRLRKQSKSDFNFDSLKKSRSSCYLNEVEDRHPWSCSVNSEEEDNLMVNTTNLLRMDNSMIKKNRLMAPGLYKNRSRSPKLGTIESVDYMEEDKPTIVRNNSKVLSTVHESCVEKKIENKSPGMFTRRRMSAVLPNFMSSSSIEDSSSDDRHFLGRRSLKGPSYLGSMGSHGSGVCNSTVISEPWNKMKVKYWKQRMSVQGIKFPNMSNNGIIQNLKKETDGILGGSMRSRKFSTTSVYALPDALGFLHDDSSKASTISSSEGLRTPAGNSFNGFFDELPPIQLEKPKWEDLHLWDPEPESWSLRHPQHHLSSSESKRQNVMYELYLTEKHHCQVIVFFQQAYQVGLRSLNILTEEQLTSLIPDVLDSLLDFHLRLLRRMKERREANSIVETVSDIVAEEFADGQLTKAAISAYTSFCISRNDSCQVYSDLCERNAKVKKFFEIYEQNPDYKKRDFKSCFLLIAQRLTKYNVLFEQILKHDPLSQRPTTQAALAAVKEFAFRIDSEMKKNDIRKAWESYKKMFDPLSKGKLLTREFSYDDLVHQRLNDPRQVISIGQVQYVNSTASTQSKSYKIELTMVLFDDILVLLMIKGNKVYFCNHNNISSVIPLKSMIAREVERTSDMRLIITNPEKTDMYLLSFQSKTELRSWISAIHSAQAKAPAGVRLAPGKKLKDPVADKEEQIYNRKLRIWEKGLEDIFQHLKDNEQKLADYMSGRMEGFDKVREHFKQFPVKHSSGSVNKEGQIFGFNEKRDQKQIEKIKNLVDVRFKELKEIRRKRLDALAENALKVRDGDLESFFDDLHDLSHASSSEKTEESSLSEGESSKKPRRVKTYHGTVDSQPRNGSIKRHTTLPKMRTSGSGSDGISLGGIENNEEEEMETMIEEELKNLPLSITMNARDAATKLIEENVKLRMENNKFKSDIAMQELHIASLKSRKTAMVETAEKLESLRQKREEIQVQDRQLKQDQELFKEELRKRKEELEERENRLKVKEADLESRMMYLHAESLRSGACVLQKNTIDSQLVPKSLSPASNPSMMALAQKTEIVKKKQKN